MARADRAGEFLRVLLDMLKGLNERVGLSEPDMFRKSFDFHTYVRGLSGGWEVGQRGVSSPHAAPAKEDSDESSIGYELYSEDPKTGVRLSEFYDFEGNLIGRSYFDRGGVPTKEVQRHLKQWGTLVPRGRPPIDSPLQMPDEEVYGLVQSRNQWYEHGTLGKEYRPTIRDAAGQLVEKLGLTGQESTEQEFKKAMDLILKAFYRGEKRSQKK